MSYTLAAAATATGLSKTTILKAIKNGQIIGTKDELGEWHVEPADLHLLDASVVPDGAGSDEDQQSAGPDVEALGAQIEALLRQAGARLRRQLDEVRRGQDEGQDGSHAPEFALADEHEQLR
jgi:hypothetical protein